MSGARSSPGGLFSFPDLDADAPLVGRQSPGKGAFILEEADLARPAYEYASGLLRGYGPDTWRLFFHVLCCGRLPGATDRAHQEPGWVPIPAVLARKELRAAEIVPLVERGLIERTGFVRPTRGRRVGRARAYRVESGVRREVADLSLDAALSGSSDRVDPFSGKPVKRRLRTSMYDRNRNPLPEPLRASLAQLTGGRCSTEPVRNHLRGLHRAHAAARGNAERARTLARFENDLRCFETVQRQGGWPDDDVFEYDLAYKVQPSGRVSHVGGGLQSCTREMKAAAYSQVPGVRNYDVRSSQAYVLQDHLRRAGIDGGWLDEYLSTDGAKFVYARDAGLSVDAWKGCLYAVFLGAALPTNAKSLGDVLAIVREDLAARCRAGDLTPTLRRLRAVLGPLHRAVGAWHRHLTRVWVPETQTYGRGGRFVTNAAGMKMPVSGLNGSGGAAVRRQLAAFVLQGQEAAFVHALTALAPSYGFVPISNEHDGIVTVGEVPTTAVDRARDAVEMPYVVLVEKPFV